MEENKIPEKTPVDKFWSALTPLFAAGEVGGAAGEVAEVPLGRRASLAAYLQLAQAVLLSLAARDGVLSDQWLEHLSLHFSGNVSQRDLALLRKLLAWNGARLDLFYGGTPRTSEAGAEFRHTAVEGLRHALGLALGETEPGRSEFEAFWGAESARMTARLQGGDGNLWWMAEGCPALGLDPLAASGSRTIPGGVWFYDALAGDGARYGSGRRELTVAGAEILVDFIDLRLRLGAFLLPGREALEDPVRASGLASHPLWLRLRGASRGFQLYRGGDYAAAGRQLQSLSLEPRYLTIALLTARALTRAGAAREALELLVALSGEAAIPSAALHSLRAELHLICGDRGRALAACDEALRHHPCDPALLKRRRSLANPSPNPPLPPAAARKTAPRAPSVTTTRADGEEKISSAELLSDMNREAASGVYAPVAGREDEMTQIQQVLLCRHKNNPLLVGDAGVGKSVLVEALAQRLVAGRVPSFLRGRRMYRLSVARLLAGSKYRGALEERVFELIDELKSERALLFIDDFHTAIAGTGNRAGSFDIANLIKPALLRGELQVIAATTFEEYRNNIERDPSLNRIFQVIKVEEPRGEALRDILDAHGARLARHHRLSYDELPIGELLELVDKYLSDRANPDKTIDVLDRAGARVALEIEAGTRRDAAGRGAGVASNVYRESRTESMDGRGAKAAVRLPDVMRVVANLSGVPYERIAAVADIQLLRMEDFLRARIVGQDEAVATVSQVIKTAKMDLSMKGDRPEGIFLFVGPTGVGKTELARALTEYLFGSEERLIRIDMSEYMERISSSRLIGAAPGYVGYNDPNQLTDKVRKNPYSLILLDEIEKADAQLLNLFLQVFDAGHLTDGKGRAVSFRDTIIIMTSNIGSEIFSRIVPGYGHGGGESGGGLDPGPYRASLDKEIRRFFPPEFLNRLDETVFFRPLAAADVDAIARLQLRSFVERMGKAGKSLTVEESAVALLAHHGYSFEFGARNLARTIRRMLLDRVATLALTPGWEDVTHLRIAARAGEIEVEPAAAGMPVRGFAEPGWIAVEETPHFVEHGEDSAKRN